MGDRETRRDTERSRETQRHRDAETQRHRDTETQRGRDTETEYECGGLTEAVEQPKAHHPEEDCEEVPDHWII